MTDDELIERFERMKLVTESWESWRQVEKDYARLITLARIGASVMPRPIEEADKKGVVPLLLFGGTFTWDTSSYDPGWMPFTGLAMTTKFDGPMDAWCGDQCEGHDQYYWHRPTHFIPISALPKPAEVTT